jgi:hypothetical protein
MNFGASCRADSKAGKKQDTQELEYTSALDEYRPAI